jgi:hypothetical protein
MENAQRLTYPAGREIIIRKSNNRWLCSPSKTDIKVRQKERAKMYNNKTALYSAQQEQHRISSKTEIMTNVNIFPSPSYKTGNHNMIANGLDNQVLVSFYNANKYISIIGRNSVSQRNIQISPPPHRYDSHMQSRSLQQIRKP